MCFGAGSENHLMFLDTGGVIVLATSVAGDFYGDFSSFDASAVIGTSFNPSDRIFDISAPYNQLIGSSSNLTIVPRGNTLEFFTRTSSTSVSSFGGLTHRHSKSVATGAVAKGFDVHPGGRYFFGMDLVGSTLYRFPLIGN